MTTPTNQNSNPQTAITEKEMVYQWVLDIPNPDTREKALLELRCMILLVMHVKSSFYNVYISFPVRKESRYQIWRLCYGTLLAR